MARSVGCKAFTLGFLGAIAGLSPHSLVARMQGSLLNTTRHFYHEWPTHGVEGILP